MSRLQNFIVVFTAVFFAHGVINADQASTNSNGLYYLSSDPSAPEVQTEPGIWNTSATIRVGEKANVKILGASVYSENNANTTFDITLKTSDFQIDINTYQKVLKVGNHWYSISGSAGKTGGPYNQVGFVTHNQDYAEEIANWLSVPCQLRSPPGYKLLVQFLPLKTAFGTNEPAIVKFKVQNLDERTITLKRKAVSNGWRNEQYGFRAQFSSQTEHLKAVPDVGIPEPSSPDEMYTGHQIKPGETFEDQIDLKKWFSFDQIGDYQIHGFYRVEIYQTKPWDDCLSADFTIIVK